MSHLDLINAYRDALHIVMGARLETKDVTVVLQKLRRVSDYLDTQAAVEFKEVLS